MFGLGRLGVNVIVKLHDRSYDQGDRASAASTGARALSEVCRASTSRRTGCGRLVVRFPPPTCSRDGPQLGRIRVHAARGSIVAIDCPLLIEKARVAADKVRLLQSAAAVVTDAAGAVKAVGRELGDRERLSF
jgi:hypothetical protein